MSIPPLVCSTPPPPEQCEEEKDHEDYDLQYNLSQEDECNDYYGEFTTYSNFQPIVSEINLDIPVDIVIQNKESEIIVSSPNTESEIVDDKKYATLKEEDDINIEDLNLEIDKETTPDGNKDDYMSETSKNNTQAVISLPAIELHTFDRELPNTIGQSVSLEKECVLKPLDIVEQEFIENVPQIEENTQLSSDSSSTPLDKLPTHGVQMIQNDNDDFDDFDDFHTAPKTSESNINVIASDNPWDSVQDNFDGFSDFKASFEDKNSYDECSNSDVKILEGQAIIENAEDEFGDFDDFKSSTAKLPSKELNTEIKDCEQNQNTSSLGNEYKLAENFNKVLYSVFNDDLTEPDTSFVTKLQSFLCETWGLLLETDIRQPYIVNWNNSKCQKSLLKALCIDSRNILFGPKWNSSMPKFAANLSNNPLQPQKQTPSCSTQNDINLDNMSHSPAAKWIDPFSADGQESLGPEANTTELPQPAKDLNMLDSGKSSMPEKIVSTSLSIQPLRQINLPDTHIFTPTDSETPRSKTIHYNSSPPMLPISKIQNEFDNEDSQIDTEYSDFQDFKGSSSVPMTDSSHNKLENIAAPKPKIIPELHSDNQILQPVKVDVQTPTLNWPDPGDVKETFDDFTDFISTSTKTSNDQNNGTKYIDINVPNIEKDVTKTLKVVNDTDNEFDTFQSAAPISSLGQLDNTLSEVSQKSKTVNKFSFNIEEMNIPKFNNTKKSDIISISEQNKHIGGVQSVNVTEDKKGAPKSLDSNFINSPVSISEVQKSVMNVLQPTVVTGPHISLPSQQNTGQILQPLSLESFSQINWPNPGINLQDLSKFNPVESLHTLKTDSTASGSKLNSPAHTIQNASNIQTPDDDIWGDFVSSKPMPLSTSKKQPTFADDDEWTDFVSSPAVKPQNGLSTISLNVHTNLNIHKSSHINKLSNSKNKIPLDVPTLNYITPNSSNQSKYDHRHFQNL